MKTCKRCLIEKPLSDFNKQAKTKDGFQSVCRDCVKKLRDVPEIKERNYKKAKERDQSPEGRIKRHASRAAHLAIPGNKEKKVAWFKSHYQKPEIKAVITERYLKNVEIPGFKENKSAVARIRNATDEGKARNAENRLAYVAIPENKAKIRIIARNRRARILGVGGEISPDLQKKLFELQRGHCAICKKRLSNNTKYQHMDHVIPITPRKGDKQGTNTDDNFQLLCQICNNRKHNKDPLKFMQEMGYLL